MTQTKQKSVAEIQEQIQDATAKQRSAGKEIDSLRKERARLAVENANKNMGEIGKIDRQIFEFEMTLSSIPAELELLQQNLSAEQARIAQAERDKLLEEQQEIANEVTLLSKGFITILKKANDINTQLRTALTAESRIREKTGKQILQNYCHGSMQSLQMLLQLMRLQMTGQRTIPTGPGMVANGTPICL
ncbi:MAG: hypothetical protein ACETWQ_22480 [Phycisphaerae bacterium]